MTAEETRTANIHATKDADKDQAHKYRKVEEKSKVDRPSVPLDGTFLDKAIVQEDQRQPGEAGREDEGQLCAECQYGCGLNGVWWNIPSVSVPAV